jgi:class 3 adenylate cyclase
MGREMKRAAVLFADICGSTKLYQTLGDANARTVVEACLSLLHTVVDRYKGRVVKSMGDEIMCVFDTADNGLLAASDMQSLVNERRPGRHPVKIHCGLHFGTVLLEEHDVFGDTVNVAAYLTAVAAEEQILTTEVTEAQLSDGLKACVRPVFRSVLKGNTDESTVFQVLWRKDNTNLTDVNLSLQRVIPGDTGSLVLRHGEESIRIDQKKPEILVGRGRECDLVVPDKFSSRQHLTIRLLRTHFYLIDHSINGTFVTRETGEEVHVLRGELLLDGSGVIVLGHTVGDKPEHVIHYDRDRRSMYRVE